MWYKNQQAYLEVIWKENKTDDVICLHFGVYGNICGHMIPSSGIIEKIYILDVGHNLLRSKTNNSSPKFLISLYFELDFGDFSGDFGRDRRSYNTLC